MSISVGRSKWSVAFILARTGGPYFTSLPIHTHTDTHTNMLSFLHTRRQTWVCIYVYVCVITSIKTRINSRHFSHSRFSPFAQKHLLNMHKCTIKFLYVLKHIKSRAGFPSTNSHTFTSLTHTHTQAFLQLQSRECLRGFLDVLFFVSCM